MLPPSPVGLKDSFTPVLELLPAFDDCLLSFLDPLLGLGELLA
jgi:hypothetical protein